MDVSFTKKVDLWVFCANFGVERGTGWNFAKVTSAKMPFFSQFLDFAKNADLTFTFELRRILLSVHIKKLDSERRNR